MAKIESVNCPSSFYVNNSSFAELKFGLEDCSPKCDFDISSLLCDNETRLKRQHIDNDDSKNNDDNKNGRSSPLTSLKTESLKLTPLDALAENHLKKNQMLPELNFDGDFSLSDLLCNDDYPNKAQNIASCESDNLFDFLLTDDDNSNVCKTPSAKNDNLFDFLVTEDNNPNFRKTSGAKNDISFDDLSQWMNSSITQTSDSSKLFNTDNFSCDSTKAKLENISSFSLQIEAKDTDKSESTNKVSNIDLVNLLRGVSIDSSGTTDDSLDSTNSFETNSKKHESTDEISDNDFLPDIDLTFCIKKKSKNDFSFYGNSPETVDSGFDESDFIPDKLSSSSLEKNSFYKDILISPTGAGNKNLLLTSKVKQSLFSRAISAKPKIDDSRKLKLKNVMKELLKGSTPLLFCDQPMNLKESQKTIDHTNDHVIISSYLKFGEEK